MIKAIIFDMDGTLYVSDEIREQFAAAAYHTLAKVKRIPLARAQELIEKRRSELKARDGFSIPYTLTLRSFDIPISIWHKENINFFDPRDYLHANKKLRQTLVELKKDFYLAVMTNNNKVQTNRVLEGLELIGLFDRIYTYNSFQILKPDPAFFRKSAQGLGVEPTSCLFVGDRYDVDLQPAKELGMQILEVKGPEDIYGLVNSTLKKE
jgi:putative hydrolase of the HAD superfamily